MKKLYLFFLIVSLSSCSSRFVTVPLHKIDADRKKVATDFVSKYLQKCVDKDYSNFENFNISARFKSKIVPDSLKKSCEIIERKYGKVKVEKLFSVHSRQRPKDFVDVFNFKISTEKNPKIQFLHLGMYRDQNYLELPFYFNNEENYLNYRKKKIKK